MRFAALVLITSVATGCASVSQSTDTAFVIDSVNVIDVTRGTTVGGQRVVVVGERITNMGPATSVATPPGAVVVDGRGKFLIPGLWDMHVHIAGAQDPEHMFGLFIANGVTGVRDMGTGVDGLIRWRAAVASRRVLGPRVVGAGVLVDGSPIVYPGITHLTTTPDEARKLVDDLAARRVDFIKAYEMLRPDVYRALASQAKAQGLPLAGHLPLMVSAEDAVRDGQRSFEHLRNLEVACSSKADSLRAVAGQMIERGQDQPGRLLRASIHAALRPRAYDTYDASRCDALIQLMAQAGVWQTPNLVLATQGVFRHDTTDFLQKWLAYMPEGLRESWSRPTSRDSAQQRARRGTEWMMTLTKKLHDGGVRVLPGSDFPNPVMFPGASLHEELALLVRAGLTSAEALQSATLNPALYLGMTDSLGTVAPRQLAELVLLDGNPLENIRNVARVRAVWRGGRYLDRQALDAMLAQLAK